LECFSWGRNHDYLGGKHLMGRFLSLLISVSEGLLSDPRGNVGLESISSTRKINQDGLFKQNFN
jgi:hypothetical protein